MPNFEFFSRSLRAKILLLFVLILVVPFSLVVLVAVNRVKEAADQDFARKIASSANLFRETLIERMKDMKIRCKVLADSDFFAASKTGFEASPTATLMRQEIARSNLDYIALIKDGTQVVSEDGTPPVENLKKHLQAICQSPLSVNLLVFEKEPWILSAAEITRFRDSPKMHVFIALRLPYFFAQNLKVTTKADFSLIYNRERILTTLMDEFGKRMLGETVRSPDVSRGEMEILREPYLFVREEVLPGMVSEAIRLEIALPKLQFVELRGQITWDFALFGVLGIALALFTGTILSLNIASPLVALAKTTAKVAEGNLEIQVASDRKDEIGLLHENFASMLKSLKTEQEQRMLRMKELNTLFEISNAVNFITDSEELLKFVLSHAVEILEAERGSIMLLDDQTDELVVKVAFGGRFRIVPGTPVKIGNGICGLVAKEGRGRICNAGFRDSDFKNFGSLLPVEDIKTLLCAPLKFKEGTIGVINAVNKRDGADFLENDLALLNLIASQAAVTIENNKLYELSITDGLTHLYVHRYFQARLSEELLRARRYGLKLSLVMIDIDNFKHFNDAYGHQVGDQVLQRVALAIRDAIRIGIDIPCRYGGEEMAVILPETRPEEALTTAERLRESIASLTVSHPLGDLHITVSIGIAGYPNDAHDRESLIMNSDKALYQSKRKGKNRTTLISGVTKNETPS